MPTVFEPIGGQKSLPTLLLPASFEYNWKQELPALRSQAGAWERESTTLLFVFFIAAVIAGFAVFALLHQRWFRQDQLREAVEYPPQFVT